MIEKEAKGGETLETDSEFNGLSPTPILLVWGGDKKSYKTEYIISVGKGLHCLVGRGEKLLLQGQRQYSR